MSTLAEILDSMTTVGDLFEKLEKNEVRCFACGHRCLIREGKRGICKVRFNQTGVLKVPWGYVGSLQLDPIEKKPLYHFMPGSGALSFGMLGCDFHCDYCQNHITSQALRDPDSDIAGGYLRRTTPEEIISLAERSNAGVIASTYNEPLITSEWAVSIFKLAKQKQIRCVYISNGNATPEAIEYLSPYLDGYKIDLKTMQDKQYRTLGGVLTHVLDSIKQTHDAGLWVEVVTLVVPGFNDSTDELMDTARFIKSVSEDIPWHVTAFHPDYKMTEPDRTSADTILRAAEIGNEAGLKYVYAGNLPGRIAEYENTTCSSCGTVVIKRSGFTINNYRITSEGTCPECGQSVAGVWSEDPGSVEVNRFGIPRPI